MRDLGEGPTTPRGVVSFDGGVLSPALASVTAPTPNLKAGMGVYAVRNLADDGVYIGAAADIGARWDRHRAALERSCHPNDALQCAWLRLGAQAFELSVLERVSRSEDLAQAARRWIDRYNGDGIYRVYNAHSQTIRRPRTPLSLDQAARRLHLSVRELQEWVRDGRLTCHDGPLQPGSLLHAGQMRFDREALNAAADRLRQPGEKHLDEIVVRLRGLQHRIGHWLHVGAKLAPQHAARLARIFLCCQQVKTPTGVRRRTGLRRPPHELRRSAQVHSVTDRRV